MKILELLATLLLLWSGAAYSQPSDIRDEFAEQVELRMSSVKISKERLRAIPLVLQDLDSALQDIWPGSRVLIFGSVVQGLATATSDVDCSIRLPHREDTSPALRDEARGALQTYPDVFTGVRPVPARIPVLTLTHTPTNFNVDLSINNLHGIQTSNLINYMLHIDENYYKLTFIVKHFAKIHGLTSTTTLPNFGVVLMVMFYLQQRNLLPSVAKLQADVKPVVVDDWNISFREIEYRNVSTPLITLLSGFFDYYEHFDYNKYIISTYSGYPIEKRFFSNVKSVPKEFAAYRYEVEANISEPLSTRNELIIQDMFVHNDNVAKLVSSKLLQKFVAYLKVTGEKFRKNPMSLLDTIF